MSQRSRFLECFRDSLSLLLQPLLITLVLIDAHLQRKFAGRTGMTSNSLDSTRVRETLGRSGRRCSHAGTFSRTTSFWAAPTLAMLICSCWAFSWCAPSICLYWQISGRAILPTCLVIHLDAPALPVIVSTMFSIRDAVISSPPKAFLLC